MRDYLIEGMKKYNIDLSGEVIDDLLVYKEFLQERNKVVNLTAIIDDKGIMEKHFIDSLALLRFFQGTGGRAVDIGTGAGFPGMVLAIANRDVEFHLVDSIGKKTKFLEELKDKLRLTNVTVVNKRSEDFIKDGKREYFDFAFSRGVSEMRIILEYTLPFLKTGGIFYAQKANYEEELANGDNALKVLKGKVEKIHEFVLPYSNDRRAVIEVVKEESCSEIYPRKSGTAEKKPL